MALLAVAALAACAASGEGPAVAPAPEPVPTAEEAPQDYRAIREAMARQLDAACGEQSIATLSGEPVPLDADDDPRSPEVAAALPVALSEYETISRTPTSFIFQSWDPVTFKSEALGAVSEVVHLRRGAEEYWVVAATAIFSECPDQ